MAQEARRVKTADLDIQVDRRVCNRAMAGLNIGQVAQRAGLSTPTVRYYESIGLLTKPARSHAGYRRYSESTIGELDFIKKARALGFSLDEIGEIVQLTRSGRRPCARVLELAKARLADLDRQLRTLAAFRSQLATELSRWEEPLEARGDCRCEMIESSRVPAGAERPDTRFKVGKGRKRL